MSKKKMLKSRRLDHVYIILNVILFGTRGWYDYVIVLF